MKFLKKNKWEIISFLFVLCIIMSPFFMGLKEFIIGYDIKNIYVPFYEEIKNIFLNGNIPFWDHNFFLGTNIWASKSYFFLGDIYSYLILLFNKMNIFDFFLLIQVTKYTSGCYFVYLLLKEIKIKKEVRWFMQLLYVFSSWSFVFLGTPAFATVVALLPLLFLGIEKYIQKKQSWLVILSSFLLIISCFYLYWSICVFLIIYWPCRYFCQYPFNKSAIIPFLKSTAYLVLIYCFGILLSAPIIFPTIDYMLNVPRVGASEIPSILWNSKKIYLDMFVKFISSPVYVNTSVSNFFGNNYYRTDQICLFTSSLMCLLLPQALVVFDKNKRIIVGTFFAICGIALLSPIGGFLFHGFSEPSFRWTFLLTLVLILIGALVLNHVERINKKLLLATLLVYILGTAFVFFVVKEIQNYPIQLSMILFSFLLMFVYVILLHKKNLMWIGIVVAIELCVIGSVTFALQDNTYQSRYDYESNGISKDYFKNLDSSFSRVYFVEQIVDMDYVQNFNYNSNLYYDYKGFYSYDSTAQGSISELLGWESEYFWWFTVRNPELLNLLSMKYVVAEYEENLPNGEFRFIEKIEDSRYSLYENMNYLPFGFSTSDILNYDEFYALREVGLWDESYAYGIVVKDKDLDHVNFIEEDEKHFMEDIIYSNNQLSGTITTQVEQLLFLSIPYDKGWTITVNGEKAEILQVEGGLMGVVLKPGVSKIEMNFIPYGFNIGCVTSIAVLGILLGGFILMKKGKRKTFLQ